MNRTLTPYGRSIQAALKLLRDACNDYARYRMLLASEFTTNPLGPDAQSVRTCLHLTLTGGQRVSQFYADLVTLGRGIAADAILFEMHATTEEADRRFQFDYWRAYPRGRLGINREDCDS